MQTDVTYIYACCGNSQSTANTNHPFKKHKSIGLSLGEKRLSFSWSTWPLLTQVWLHVILHPLPRRRLLHFTVYLHCVSRFKIDFIFLCKMHVVCKQTALLCIKNISLENLSLAMFPHAVDSLVYGDRHKGENLVTLQIQ